MILVKVQYDAYNRTFKLVDSSLGCLLDDYALYDLAIPFAGEEAAEPEEQDYFISIEPTMAHA
jgi:hypothetical protein